MFPYPLIPADWSFSGSGTFCGRQCEHKTGRCPRQTKSYDLRLNLFNVPCAVRARRAGSDRRRRITGWRAYIGVTARGRGWPKFGPDRGPNGYGDGTRAVQPERALARDKMATRRGNVRPSYRGEYRPSRSDMPFPLRRGTQPTIGLQPIFALQRCVMVRYSAARNFLLPPCS